MSRQGRMRGTTRIPRRAAKVGDLLHQRACNVSRARNPGKSCDFFAGLTSAKRAQQKPAGYHLPPQSVRQHCSNQTPVEASGAYQTSGPSRSVVTTNMGKTDFWWLREAIERLGLSNKCTEAQACRHHVHPAKQGTGLRRSASKPTQNIHSSSLPRV